MNSFWQDKKVLVTGAWGFVGSHLAQRLLREGAKVCVLNQTERPANNSIWTGGQITQLAEVCVGNVTDADLIFEIFRNHGINYCFHLAAQPLVDVASANPLPTFATNISGTGNILEAARQYQVRGVVVASTSHVYGDVPPPFVEDLFPRPSRPYETSKACADLLAQTYANYYELPVGIARCVNIYGPGDHNTRIVPRTIELLLAGQRPELFSENATRDYLFIDDAVAGYLVLAERIGRLRAQQQNVIYNFGTGQHYSTRQVIDYIRESLGRTDLEPIVIPGARRQEIVQQYVSTAKAQIMLAWRPQVALLDGLKRTVDWYRRRINK